MPVEEPVRQREVHLVEKEDATDEEQQEAGADSAETLTESPPKELSCRCGIISMSAKPTDLG